VGQQLGQAGFAVGRGRFDVQQPRQPGGPRQQELLLKARDFHAGIDLAVALPVDPDEYVALGQVGLVQLPRRMRPRTGFEHHGVSRGAEMARATARRSAASSPSVELTNTRSR
jgi:hypothetical protein